MLQSFCKRILYRWMGFSEVVTETRPEKYIIVMAPHTSNWDFVVGTLYARAEGFQCNFLIKKEWFFWPMGILMRKLGGIPVYRDKKTGSTERLATLAMESKEFHLCITPEGTRQPNREWKRGFYYIALKAQLPILLYGLDYRKKVIECTKVIIPNGDVEGQMAKIKEYFAQFTAKKPENFSI